MKYSTITDAAYAVSNAIGDAEGYFNADPNAIPKRANNPGDLFLGNRYGLGTLGEGVTVFPKADSNSAINDKTDGWAWLRRMIIGWYELKSHIYMPEMTILEVASHYTRTDPTNWAKAVAGKLGIQPTDTLASILLPGVEA